MANSADPDQLASSEANIWIYSVCKGRTYLGLARLGLRLLKCFLISRVVLTLSTVKIFQQTTYWKIFLTFPRKQFWHFMQIVSSNLHENIISYFLGKIPVRKILSIFSSAELAKRVVMVNIEYGLKSKKPIWTGKSCSKLWSGLNSDWSGYQGPVVQSVVSLTSSLVVKLLTVLVSTIPNSQVFLLKKMWVAFANAKTPHIFFSQNISVYAIFNDFNDMLTNDIVSFEQLGPEFYCIL